MGSLQFGFPVIVIPQHIEEKLCKAAEPHLLYLELRDGLGITPKKKHAVFRSASSANRFRKAYPDWSVSSQSGS